MAAKRLAGMTLREFGGFVGWLRRCHLARSKMVGSIDTRRLVGALLPDEEQAERMVQVGAVGVNRQRLAQDTLAIGIPSLLAVQIGEVHVRRDEGRL